MKKKLLFIFIIFLFPLIVNADTINSLDIKVNINKDGSSSIEEVWNVTASSGSEWYKTMYNLGDSVISDFVVYMDGNELTYKNWNINESLSDKAGYYGIVNTDKGVELCFGKSDFNNHTFTLKYNISNTIFNVSDAQVFYWTLFPKATVLKFNVIISSYFSFPDTLPVWGYGNDGLAYVENGKIYLSGSLYNDSVIALVEFPTNSFDTSYKTKYETFNDVFDIAEDGVRRINTINKIDIDAFINSEGTLEVNEIWNAKGYDDDAWVKKFQFVYGAKLTDLEIYVDDIKYELVDVIGDKTNCYAIEENFNVTNIYIYKADKNSHTIKFKYNLKNAIINTNDSQILYKSLVYQTYYKVNMVNINLQSYYKLEDEGNLFGSKLITNYISKYEINYTSIGSNDSDIDDIALLIKFPTNTFDTIYKVDALKNYESALLDIQDKYDIIDLYEMKMEKILKYVIPLSCILIFILFCIFEIKKQKNIKKYRKVHKPNYNYGYYNNKKIKLHEIPYYREIPCNKDIYYANVLLKLNKFEVNKYVCKNSNIVGALILKWVKEGVISFDYNGNSFNRKVSVIKFNDKILENPNENKLLNYMKEASKDGILTIHEFEKWSNNNFDLYLNCLYKFEKDTLKEMENNNLIVDRKNENECAYAKILTDEVYNESIKLFGLKKYLDDFSSVDTKEVIDVKLWDEYLMYAYLFGNAKKVIKQLKYMYPDLPEMNAINYSTLDFISDISYRSYSVSRSSYSKAHFNYKSLSGHSSGGGFSSGGSSYSSGGGGHSSSSGGGGSFGGGGSAGGR